MHDVKVKGYLLKIKKPQIHSIYSFGTSSGGKLNSKNVMSLTREKKEKKGLPNIVMCAVLSCFSRVQLFATQWTVAHQAPLSMGFSRQEYWSGLPCPLPADLSGPKDQIHVS